MMDRRDFMLGAASLSSLTFTPLACGRTPGHSPLGYIRTNWSKDPYAYGAYSFIAKGSGGGDIRALGRPVDDRVFFAGEAVHPRRNSSMHAAHESGLWVAEAVSAHRYERIAVLGAGMSGLTAAQALSRSGHEVEVFEARDRIGGRLWTDHSLGLPLDLGASWIHGATGNPLTGLARQAGSATVATDTSYIIRGANGEQIPDEATPDWLEDVLGTQHPTGADPDEMNRFAYLFRAGEYEGDELIFPDGYETVLRALEGDYAVHLSTPVQSVRYGETGVELVGTETSTFDAVIVTAPLGVLKRGDIGFEPALPRRTQRAIDRLGMGLLDKLYLKFDSVFWDREPTWIVTPDTGLPEGQFNQWLNLAKFLDAPVLLGFNGGTPARDLSELDDQTFVQRGLQALARAYPEI